MGLGRTRWSGYFLFVDCGPDLVQMWLGALDVIRYYKSRVLCECRDTGAEFAHYNLLNF